MVSTEMDYPDPYPLITHTDLSPDALAALGADGLVRVMSENVRRAQEQAAYVATGGRQTLGMMLHDRPHLASIPAFVSLKTALDTLSAETEDYYGKLVALCLSAKVDVRHAFPNGTYASTAVSRDKSFAGQKKKNDKHDNDNKNNRQEKRKEVPLEEQGEGEPAPKRTRRTKREMARLRELGLEPPMGSPKPSKKAKKVAEVVVDDAPATGESTEPAIEEAVAEGENTPEIATQTQLHRIADSDADSDDDSLPEYEKTRLEEEKERLAQASERSSSMASRTSSEHPSGRDRENSNALTEAAMTTSRRASRSAETPPPAPSGLVSSPATLTKRADQAEVERLRASSSSATSTSDASDDNDAITSHVVNDVADPIDALTTGNPTFAHLNHDDASAEEDLVVDGHTATGTGNVADRSVTFDTPAVESETPRVEKLLAGLDELIPSQTQSSADTSRIATKESLSRKSIGEEAASELSLTTSKKHNQQPTPSDDTGTGTPSSLAKTRSTPSKSDLRRSAKKQRKLEAKKKRLLSSASKEQIERARARKQSAQASRPSLSFAISSPIITSTTAPTPAADADDEGLDFPAATQGTPTPAENDSRAAGPDSITSPIAPKRRVRRKSSAKLKTQPPSLQFSSPEVPKKKGDQVTDIRRSPRKKRH